MEKIGRNKLEVEEGGDKEGNPLVTILRLPVSDVTYFILSVKNFQDYELRIVHTINFPLLTILVFETTCLV